MARIYAVSIADKKGQKKKPQRAVRLETNHGVVGDAHAGDWHRQVSLLARESIAKMRAKGLDVDSGSFAENITTEGIDLCALPIGTKFGAGEAVLEVTQIGKECHSRCEIYLQAGDCVMPREGVFARVVRGGEITAGDSLTCFGQGGEEDNSFLCSIK